MDIYKNAKKAVLLLEDGSLYEGYHVGAAQDAFGELVFNTAVVGYQQLLTDPANENNILISTFPMLGNYGVVEGEDDLSAVHAQAVVMREWCASPSNYRSTGRLDDWMERKGIAGIFGVDTRALTRKVRDHSVMKAMVTTNPVTEENKTQLLAELKNYRFKTPQWKTNTETVSMGQGSTKLTVVDFGVRRDVLDALMARGAQLTVVPSSTSAQEILAAKPQGIVLCGGWADFNDTAKELETVCALTKSGIPMLGIGVGHQLMGLAAGGCICKMKAGHRGCNCPVSECATGHTFITTQNHGCVVQNTDSSKAQVTYINSNDKTCEGLRYLEYPGMSVQFVPECEIGRKNFDGIYEAFFNMLNK